MLRSVILRSTKAVCLLSLSRLVIASDSNDCSSVVAILKSACSDISSLLARSWSYERCRHFVQRTPIMLRVVPRHRVAHLRQWHERLPVRINRRRRDRFDSLQPSCLFAPRMYALTLHYCYRDLAFHQAWHEVLQIICTSVLSSGACQCFAGILISFLCCTSCQELSSSPGIATVNMHNVSAQIRLSLFLAKDITTFLGCLVCISLHGPCRKSNETRLLLKKATSSHSIPMLVPLISD